MTRPYHPSPGLRASDIVWPRTDGYEPLEPAPADDPELLQMIAERDALSDKGLMHASEAVEQAYYRKLKQKGDNNAK